MEHLDPSSLVRGKNFHIKLQYLHIDDPRLDFSHLVFWSSVTMVDKFQQDWLLRNKSGDFTGYQRILPPLLKDWLPKNIGVQDFDWCYDPYVNFFDAHWRFLGFKEKHQAMHFILKWS